MEAGKMESMVQDYEKRILELEKDYSEVKKEITVVQTSQSKIENMLYTQNTEQKELINNHQNEQRQLLDTLLAHTLGIKKDTNQKKWETIAVAVGGAVGGGSVLYLIIEVFIK
ncbi:hypothetical protein DCC39_17160 [Pueribacillus theae]|uniref:Uncharacterized protein n=1 Tax=Pueribacillus theae TaxID=2171751 RepID=A0A2U1JPR0_9BACI|nr:hypothetical protein [Pueribacillus theae]PWA06995.1 hypothetical protein DCC39_17160 [Pueribacillus theae]